MSTGRRSDATKNAILAAARERFAGDGYELACRRSSPWTGPRSSSGSAPTPQRYLTGTRR